MTFTDQLARRVEYKVSQRINFLRMDRAWGVYMDITIRLLLMVHRRVLVRVGRELQR